MHDLENGQLDRKVKFWREALLIILHLGLAAQYLHYM